MLSLSKHYFIPPFFLFFDFKSGNLKIQQSKIYLASLPYSFI